MPLRQSEYPLLPILFAILLASVCSGDDQPLPIQASEARNYTGKQVVVDFIVSACKELDDKRLCFLNAERDFTNPKDITVVITPKAFEALKPNVDFEKPWQYFVHRVRVTGTVELYKQKPQIKIDSLDQIEVLEKPAQIKLEDAKNFVNKGVIVEFKVQSGKEMDDKSCCFLNSEKDYQDPRDFELYITPGAISGFERTGNSQPADYFLNKTVRVTGFIDLYKGKPQIKISFPEQIRVTESEK